MHYNLKTLPITKPFILVSIQRQIEIEKTEDKITNFAIRALVTFGKEEIQNQKKKLVFPHFFQFFRRLSKWQLLHAGQENEDKDKKLEAKFLHF